MTFAKSQFRQVVEKEHERLKSLAEIENKRILTKLKQENEQTTCPLCLEDLPPICPMKNFPTYMPCCGVEVCMDCGNNWSKRQDKSKVVCFHCRRPGLKLDYKTLSVDGCKSGKAYAFLVLSLKERDPKKAFEYMKKAAELGDVVCQSKLGYTYVTGVFLGTFKELAVPKSIEKGMELLKKAAEQGEPHALAKLAKSIEESQGIFNRESFELYSLGAYQDHHLCMLRLSAQYTIAFLDALVYEGPSALEKKTVRMYMILSLYWMGRAFACKKLMTTNGGSLQTFLVTLDIAMQTWHKRSFLHVEPLPGCSHVPLVKCISGFIQKHHPGLKSNIDPYVPKHSAWSEICGNCGNQEKNKLKVCARCKAFSYCSKECQVKHWKAGHKVDCKRHWIEEFIPNIRTPKFHGNAYQLKHSWKAGVGWTTSDEFVTNVLA